MNAKARQLVTAILAVILALTMGQAGAFAYAQDPEAAGQSDPTEPTKTAAEMVWDGGPGAGAGSDPSGPGTTDPGNTGSGDTDPGNLDPGNTGTSDDATTASSDGTETPGDAGETTTDTTAKPTTTNPTTPTTKPTTTTTKAKPTVPKVKVTRKGPGLRVSWNKIEGVNYYEVYRSYKRGSKGKLLKKVKGKTAFTDKSVKSGKRAYYKVRAHKKKGGFYGYSKAATNVIYRVYIEAGHGIDKRGRWDPGCTWNKYQEAKLMIPICKSMAKHLRAKGVYVYTDAFKGNNRNLFWLVKHIKNYDVSVLVNVHCDYKKAPRGTLPLYRYQEQKKLAKCLNEGVHKTVKIKDRGLKKRKDLMTLNRTKKYCTTCLFETGNIKKDNKILRKQSDAYGKGLAMGVCSYLGVEW